MKFIILDRDGVINFDSDYYIKSPDEWNPIPGSLEAIAALNRQGYRVLVATNQSGVARKLYTMETLEKIHEKLVSELKKVGGEIEEIFFCPHHPDELCSCRKPQPGLLQEIEKKYLLKMSEIYFIGDSIADIRAAQAVGCQPVLVMTGNGKKTLEKNPDVSNIPQYENLAQAVEKILGQTSTAFTG